MPMFVYLLASRKQGTLYLGITKDIIRRIAQHKHKILPGFTKRYDVRRLVRFECCEAPTEEIEREK
jgi:putative endonuclease